MLKKSHLTSGISGKDNLCGGSIFHLKLGQCVLFGSVFLVGPLSKIAERETTTFALGKGPYGGTDRLSWGSGVFGKIWGRSAVTFASEKIAYDGGRSEFGLSRSRAAGHFCFREIGPIEQVHFCPEKNPIWGRRAEKRPPPIVNGPGILGKCLTCLSVIPRSPQCVPHPLAHTLCL